MREDRSKLSWVGIGIVALVAIPALLIYGLLASSAVVSLFNLSAFDAGFYLCLAIGFFTVLHIANYLTELHRDVTDLHNRIVSEQLRAAGRDYISQAEREADDLEKAKTDYKISALGRAITWIVILALSMILLSHLSNQKRIVASYQNWREGVIEGAAERSRGGGCGSVVREYFDDLDQSAGE